MFLKLFKHAFKRSAKIVIMLSCISVGIGLFSGIFFAVAHKFSENVYIQTLASVMLAMATFGISALNLCSLIIVYNHFRKAVTTDEAYLTFTLPATPRQQLGSRYLAILLWDIISGAVSALSYILLIVISGVFVSSGDGNISEITLQFDVIMIIIEAIVLSVTIFFSLPIHIMFALVFNNVLSIKMKSKASIIIVVLLAYGEYVALGILLSVMLVMAAVLNSVAVIHVALWLFIAIIGGLGVLFYLLMQRYFGKKLNLA